MVTGKNSKRFAFLFLFLVCVIWIMPILWLIINSFREETDFITSYANIKGPWDYLTRLFPKKWTIVSYIELFVGGEGTNTNANMLVMFKNTLIVSTATTFGVVIITSLSAYAYERLKFKGGNKIFWSLMYLSMIPNVVVILPLFRVCNSLKWVDNLNSLIWPSRAGVFNIYLIRNFMKSIPLEIDEAASIDGANSFQTYSRIIIPCIKPVLFVVGLLAFNTAWNDFLWPSIIMSNPDNQTLTPGLKLLSGQYENKTVHLIASCLVSMLPPLILYLAAQKYLLQGMALQTAVKG